MPVEPASGPAPRQSCSAVLPGAVLRSASDPCSSKRSGHKIHMHRAAALLLLAAALPSSGLRSSTSHRAAPPLLVRAWPTAAARAHHPLCSSSAVGPPAAAEVDAVDAVDAQAAALALKRAEDREIISIAGPALLNTVCLTGLEPQPSRLKIDLPLSRASPALDRTTPTRTSRASRAGP